MAPDQFRYQTLRSRRLALFLTRSSVDADGQAISRNLSSSVACIDPVCGVAMKTTPFTELRNACVSALYARRPSAARRTCFTTRPPRLWHTKTSGTPVASENLRFVRIDGVAHQGSAAR